MIIDRAIVSTDENSLYYEFWPMVAKGWRNIGIEPTAAVIGSVNLNYAFGKIIRVPQIDGVPNGFIAQVIRFIIPCFFPEQVSIIGDMDMIPLSKEYFQNTTQYSDDAILVFSADAYIDQVRYPMCYIAAKGKYFQQIIGLKDLKLKTISAFIRDLYALGKGWDTDELFFAAKLHASPLFDATVLMKRGGWKPFARNRIDRGRWRYSKAALFRDQYIDAHCVRPLHENRHALKDINEYLQQGSSGKNYLMHLFKQPIKRVLTNIKRYKQNYFANDLYDILSRQLSSDKASKVISFSLYGSNPRYTKNLNVVLKSYKEVYADWKCRVYVANDVSEEILALLAAMEADIFIMKGTSINASYMNWRFLAIEDSTVEVAIFRDLDSVATLREKRMVDDWLSSGKSFHIIRDHITHNARIMGGMWGARRANINIRQETKKMLMVNGYGIDQVFLEEIIFPQIKEDVLIHDSYPRFPDERPIIVSLPVGETFIGEVLTDEMARKTGRILLEQHFLDNFTLK